MTLAREFGTCLTNIPERHLPLALPAPTKMRTFALGPGFQNNQFEDEENIETAQYENIYYMLLQKKLSFQMSNTIFKPHASKYIIV